MCLCLVESTMWTITLVNTVQKWTLQGFDMLAHVCPKLSCLVDQALLKHKTQVTVLVNSATVNTATCWHMLCSKTLNPLWCQNTTACFDLASPDEHCNASMCLHVGRPKDHLASVPRSHFELHTAQFASPISHASLHMCTRAHTRTVYAHRKLNGGNYTEFILPGCAFKCKLSAANFSFWTL